MSNNKKEKWNGCAYLMARLKQLSEDIRVLEEAQDRLYDNLKSEEFKEIKLIIFGGLSHIDKARCELSNEFYRLLEFHKEKFGRKPNFEGDPPVLVRLTGVSEEGAPKTGVWARDRRSLVEKVRTDIDEYAGRNCFIEESSVEIEED